MASDLVVLHLLVVSLALLFARRVSIACLFFVLLVVYVAVFVFIVLPFASLPACPGLFDSPLLSPYSRNAASLVVRDAIPSYIFLLPFFRLLSIVPPSSPCSLPMLPSYLSLHYPSSSCFIFHWPSFFALSPPSLRPSSLSPFFNLFS